VRFSHPEQAKGDSLRRQTDLAASYCERRGWRLSDATYRDLGVSAFRGKNALVGNLGEFLKAVKGGGVRPGEALIVESLDRISRQGIDEGYDLIKSILKAGVRLVTLSPEREFDATATKSLSKGALEIQLILERAAEESEIKSRRMSAAWRAKQARARETLRPVTRKLPLWLEEEGGRIRLIPERAEAVRRMFALAGSGYGFGLIVRQLAEEGVPAFSGKTWLKQYVAEVVGDRRALGEYQPRKGRKPDGPPIPGYYPACVTEEQWLAARAGAAQRKHRPGRVGRNVNVFAGLVYNARDGDTYIHTTRMSGQSPGRPGTPLRVLVTTAYAHGRGCSMSFPFLVFERAVFALLREIDPREILGRTDGHDAVMTLTGELGEVESRISALEATLEDGEVAAVVRKLRELEARQKELVQRLQLEREKAANPLSASWGEARGLLDVLDANDGPDVRLRLRAALRRIVKSIWLLVVPRGRCRLAAVQVKFEGGKKRRDYLILHRATMSNGASRKEGGWLAKSLAGVMDGGLDLADKEHAGKLERVLLSIDLETLRRRLS
jgi:DNA invertase Pin-like site-specific DNA recombinase